MTLVRHFPSEFGELLAPAAAHSPRSSARGKPRGAFRFAWIPAALGASQARACRRLLDRALYPHLRPSLAPIDPQTVWGMRRNHDERLPKTMRFKTAILGAPRSQVFKAAARINLIAMLRSETLAAFAERVTGLPLCRGPGMQVIVYEAGDHVGPHNDHHPENPQARRGYVDVHISLPNRGVAHQWLVYEEDGYLTRVCDCSSGGAVAVYRLPFWHYTTPLAAKKGREASARRWLLLATFAIDWAQLDRRLRGHPSRA